MVEIGVGRMHWPFCDQFQDLAYPTTGAEANVFPGLAGSAISVASKTPSSQQQTMLLEQTKTFAESAVQLLYNVQEAGGNPKV